MMYVTRMISLFKTIKRKLRVVCNVRLAQLSENQSRFSTKTLLVDTKTLELWHKHPARPCITPAVCNYNSIFPFCS